MKWLKKYNKEYHDIEIAVGNLSWMGENEEEQELPYVGESFECVEHNTCNEQDQQDKGPVEKAADELAGNEDMLSSVGLCPEYFGNIPKQKDNGTVQSIKESCKKAKIPSVSHSHKT